MLRSQDGLAIRPKTAANGGGKRPDLRQRS